MIQKIFKVIQCMPAILTLTASASPKSTVESYLSSRPHLGRYGMYVLDAKTGQPLFSKNETLALNPASALKILVSAASFEKLGLGHVFLTKVFHSGSSLCLRGGGDPSLVQESLHELAKLSAQRLDQPEKITQLWVDESLFPSENPFSNSFEGDSDRAFTADVGALSLNFNSVAVRVEPTKLGQKAKVFVSPDIPEILVQNKTMTASNGNKKSIGLRLQSVEDGKILLTVSGSVSLTPNQNKLDDFFTLYASVPSNPGLYVGRVFSQSLRAAGVNVQEVKLGTCPANARLLFSWASKPLSSIVQDMNIYSNNFIAEMLLRSLGARHDKSGGLEELRGWMRTQRIPEDALVLDNASGLSRLNRITPKTLAHVMLKAMTNIHYGPEFLASLSINGQTGTMRNRIKRASNAPSEEGFIIRAKSGTLSNAVSLVGRAVSAEKDLVFAFIFNDSKYPAHEIQQVENTILKMLLEIH